MSRVCQASGGGGIAARAVMWDMGREWWHRLRQERRPSRPGEVAYLLGSSIVCQRGANSHFFRGFSLFRPMHQNFVPYVNTFRNL